MVAVGVAVVVGGEMTKTEKAVVEAAMKYYYTYRGFFRDTLTEPNDAVRKRCEACADLQKERKK